LTACAGLGYAGLAPQASAIENSKLTTDNPSMIGIDRLFRQWRIGFQF
jgi:hypothetical protein